VTDPALGQAAYAIRLEWGPTGAAAIGADADIAVVVDVLSFTTTLTVAVDQGWPSFRSRGRTPAPRSTPPSATLCWPGLPDDVLMAVSSTE
jgi:2-phosphosulfolactate phosphatase